MTSRHSSYFESALQCSTFMHGRTALKWSVIALVLAIMFALIASTCWPTPVWEVEKSVRSNFGSGTSIVVGAPAAVHVIVFALAVITISTLVGAFVAIKQSRLVEGSRNHSRASRAIGIALVAAAIMTWGYLHQRVLASNAVSSLSRARAVYSMFHVYMASHRNALPSQAIFSEDGRPLLSWRVSLLKYEDPELYAEFRMDEPWDSDHNKGLITRMPEVYRSNGSGVNAQGKTHFVLLTGPRMLFHQETDFVRIQKDARDGTYETALVVEVDEEHAVTWTKPDDWAIDLSNPRAAIGRFRGNGFIVVMVNGSVKYLDMGQMSDQDLASMFNPDDRGQGLAQSPRSIWFDDHSISQGHPVGYVQPTQGARWFIAAAAPTIDGSTNRLQSVPVSLEQGTLRVTLDAGVEATFAASSRFLPASVDRLQVEFGSGAIRVGPKEAPVDPTSLRVATIEGQGFVATSRRADFVFSTDVRGRMVIDLIEGKLDLKHHSHTERQRVETPIVAPASFVVDEYGVHKSSMSTSQKELLLQLLNAEFPAINRTLDEKPGIPPPLPPIPGLPPELAD